MHELFNAVRMWLEILEQRMERPLIRLLDQLGGWPILKPNWDPDKFDWLRLTAQLRLYNNEVLISEWVGPDIKNSDKYVIQVTECDSPYSIILVSYHKETNIRNILFAV